MEMRDFCPTPDLPAPGLSESGFRPNPISSQIDGGDGDNDTYTFVKSYSQSIIIMMCDTNASFLDPKIRPNRKVHKLMSLGIAIYLEDKFGVTLNDIGQFVNVVVYTDID